MKNTPNGLYFLIYGILKTLNKSNKNVSELEHRETHSVLVFVNIILRYKERRQLAVPDIDLANDNHSCKTCKHISCPRTLPSLGTTSTHWFCPRDVTTLTSDPSGCAISILRQSPTHSQSCYLLGRSSGWWWSFSKHRPSTNHVRNLHTRNQDSIRAATSSSCRNSSVCRHFGCF